TSFAAIGLALHGRVDAERGLVRELRQAPDWHGYPLAAGVAEHWRVPVHMASAVNAAGVAGMLVGAGGGAGNVFDVHCGRSVAAALVTHGHSLHGAHGAEGMLAHLIVRPEGPRCSCGRSGHLEPLASAQSIVRRMIGRASDSDESAAAMQQI